MKKLMLLLFSSVLVFTLAMPVFAQDTGSQEAPKTDPRYYYRPWKTILVRTIADGGESFYVQGDHRLTVPMLYSAALQAKTETDESG